jgi:hypothetical protein
MAIIREKMEKKCMRKKWILTPLVGILTIEHFEKCGSNFLSDFRIDNAFEL